MSKLDKDIRFNVKSGTSFPAVVVSVFQNKASVRLLSNGAILRDLDVVGGNVQVGQNVKVDYTTAKPTVLSNNFSPMVATAAASAAWGKTPPGGEGGGDVTEGPGIDILGKSVGFGGDTCLIYNSNGDPVEEFVATDDGLSIALGAMHAGDVLELPDYMISGGPWTITNGTMRGHSRFGTILDGQVTVGNGCTLENLSIIRTELTAPVIYGVVVGINAHVNFCYISLTSVYSSRGIYCETTGGYSHANDNIIIANCSGTGTAYAYYVGRQSGDTNALLYATGGMVRATTAPVGEQSL